MYRNIPLYKKKQNPSNDSHFNDPVSSHKKIDIFYEDKTKGFIDLVRYKDYKMLRWSLLVPKV